MENTLQVGQEIIRRVHAGCHYRGTITKVTNTMYIVDDGKKYYRSSWRNYCGWHAGLGEAKGTEIKAIENDADRVKIMQTKIYAEEFKEAMKQRRLENEKKREAHEEWLKTPEGILKTKQDKEWYGAEIEVDHHTDVEDDRRISAVKVIVDGKTVGEVSVCQYKKYGTDTWETGVNWSAMGEMSPEVAGIYAKAITKASEIAKEWKNERYTSRRVYDRQRFSKRDANTSIRISDSDDEGN